MEYRRRNPGQSVPVDDSLSRLLMHSPEYVPFRPRRSQRKPIQNPGVFTVQAIASALGTTVGDLLGEPMHVTPSEFLSVERRRLLRDATRLLRELFDLYDPAL
jgi:hypothetical protein